MKLDQIAIYATTNEDADRIKAQFSLTYDEWIQDTVTAFSIVEDKEGENVAELQFNYSLGIELEIIRYVKGANWHQHNPLVVSKINRGIWTIPPFISHVGIHLEDDEKIPEMKHCRLVQETFTLNHTSEYLTKPGSPGFGRKYHYRIFELSPGSYVKYIKRVHPAS